MNILIEGKKVSYDSIRSYEKTTISVSSKEDIIYGEEHVVNISTGSNSVEVSIKKLKAAIEAIESSY